MGAGLSTTQTKAFRAEAAVTKRRIVCFGAGDDLVIQSSAAASAHIGVSSEIDVVTGEPCDVHLAGIAEVEFGGTVTRGALLTSDATGRAIAATAAAGTNIRTIGVAMCSAVVGDIGPILLEPGSFQG